MSERDEYYPTATQERSEDDERLERIEDKLSSLRRSLYDTDNAIARLEDFADEPNRISLNRAAKKLEAAAQRIQDEITELELEAQLLECR